MSFSDFLYDISLLGGIMIVAALMTILAHNLFETAYWRYVDWKNDRENR